MSTKAQITTAINTNLASASDITATELRSVENTFLDEHFPSTTNYVLNTGNYQYDLNFTKSGNFCHVHGFIKNGNTVAVNGENFFTIPDSIYYPKITTYMLGFLEGSATGKRLYIGQSSDPTAPNKIRLMNGIGVGDIVRINTTYIVND